MYYKGLVDIAFNEAVTNHKHAPVELKQALRNSETVKQALSKLARDFELVAAKRASQGKPNIAHTHIKDVVTAAVDTYVGAIKTMADRRLESELARIARESKERDAKDLDQSASGTLTGDYADLAKEAGITMTDERDMGI